MSEFIGLTVITVRLKKETKDNIAKSFLGDAKSKKSKDDYGRDAAFYRELGIDPPEELESGAQKSQGNSFKVSEGDLETIESPAMFRLDSLVFFVAGEKEGSTIYLDIDYKASVKETVKEIELKINKLSKKSKDVVK
jgi:hypothetical protein